MRVVLSRFTKQIVIEDYFSNLPILSKLNNVDDLHGYFLKNEIKELLLETQFDRFSNHDNVQIVLKDHAFQRWGQRVGRSNNKTLLEYKIHILYSLLDRVELLSPEFGLIDKEILFTYKRENNKIIISTFYGRLSQNPALYHFDAMRNYNLQQDEYIDLSLDQSTLSNLVNPPIPTQRMIFKGNRTRYMIDKYSDAERSVLIMTVLEGQEKGVVREIYSNEPKCEKLGKSVLQALLLLGQDEFVYNHIAFHYPDELSKRLNKFKTQ